MKYKVLRDTREKVNNGYIFDNSAACEGTDTVTLHTGDYSLDGFYENKYFVVERKGSISELATNLTDPRFFRELERLKEFKFAWIFCDFYIDDVMLFPATSGIPKSKLQFIKVTPQFLMMKINEIQVKYNVRFMFVGPYGRDVLSSLFKRILEDINK